MSVVMRWREEIRHRVWTCDEMKLELGQNKNERLAQRRVATATVKKAAEMHARTVSGVPKPTNQLYTLNDDATATLKDLKDTLAR